MSIVDLDDEGWWEVLASLETVIRCMRTKSAFELSRREAMASVRNSIQQQLFRQRVIAASEREVDRILSEQGSASDAT